MSYRVKKARKTKTNILLTHICRIKKNGIDDLICRAEIETQT